MVGNGCRRNSAIRVQNNGSIKVSNAHRIIVRTSASEKIFTFTEHLYENILCFHVTMNYIPRMHETKTFKHFL